MCHPYNNATYNVHSVDICDYIYQVYHVLYVLRSRYHYSIDTNSIDRYICNLYERDRYICGPSIWDPNQ